MLELVFPLAELYDCCYHLTFAPDLPERIETAGNRVRQALLELLISTAAANPGEHLALHVACSDDELTITFPASAELDEARHLHLPGGSWRDGHSFTLPARTLQRRSREQSAVATSALIISDEVSERRSLQCRLTALGVNATTVISNPMPDICFVASEDAPGFKSIQAMLPEGIPVVSLRSRSILARPGWQQLDGPPTQQRLLEALGGQRDQRQAPPSLKVMIVDDSEANAGLLSLQLSELGHIPITAADGETALALLERDAIDLVFMDAQMPGMDGVATTHALRARGHHMPVLGLTAHVSQQENSQYLAAGMSEVLTKPIRRDVLASLLAGHERHTPVAAKRPAATAQEPLPIIDIELALLNANQRQDIAAELLGLLIDNLQQDQRAINQAEDPAARKAAVHRLHGAVRYCGVPRLNAAVEKLEVAIKQGDEEACRLCLNLLNGEISALTAWYQDNPDPFADAAVPRSAADY